MNSLNLEILPYLRQYIRNTESDWNYITPPEFYKQYFSKKRNDYVLVDLRRSEDYDVFHIPGSINIFWLELLSQNNIKKLLKCIHERKEIFLICYVGHTSSQAMTLLKLLGISVTSIKFGYGLSPSKNVPIAGWLQYNYPIMCKECKECEL